MKITDIGQWLLSLNGNGHNKTKAELENMSAKSIYFNKLVEYSLVRFKWENLPPDFDERFMEINLNFKGGFVAFKNKYDKLVVTDYATSGRLNMYYNPTSVYSITIDGQHEELKDGTFVCCWNNWLRQPTINVIDEFSDRISDITRTLDVIVNSEKIPYIFVGDRKRVLTLKNIFRQVRRNEPAIYVDEEFSRDKLYTIDLKHQFNGTSVFELKRSIWAECLTFLGIDNSSISKRERVNTAEVDESNTDTEMSRYAGLVARRDFCKEFNKMFGTNIWVHYRTFEDETVTEEEQFNTVITKKEENRGDV